MKRTGKKERGKKADRPQDEVRPIGARALKSARDTLRPYFAGARVLDLYAGQGRFGFAAEQEGAAAVCFVELNRLRAAELRRAAEPAPHCVVLTADVFDALADAELGQFDLIFADPPFPYWADDFCERLFRAVAPHLNKRAIFLVKHPKRVVLSVPKQDFFLWKSVPFGEANLAYYRYGEE